MDRAGGDGLSGWVSIMPAPQPPLSPLIVVRAFAPAPANWLPAHRGVDLLATPGQAVRAPISGSVAYAGRVAGRPVLVLRVGRKRFTFEPVHSSAAVGEQVVAGERIGVVTHGGHCDARCLHWGAKRAGQYVNPLNFLPRTAPVLKPVVP